LLTSIDLFLAEQPTWRPFFSSFSPHLPSKYRVNSLTKIFPKSKKGKNLGKYPRGIYSQVFTRTLTTILQIYGSLPTLLLRNTMCGWGSVRNGGMLQGVASQLMTTKSYGAIFWEFHLICMRYRNKGEQFFHSTD
jgi:hypothetical protein